MIRTAALIALASTLGSPALADTRFAIIVGHNLGDLHETPLRWAESDAERMRDLLTELGDVGADRAVLLLRPTLEELRAARLRMDGRLQEAKLRGERTTLFFFFSGHADNEELHLGREKLELAALERELKDGPATTVLAIVDACRNDRTPRVLEKGAVRAPPFRWPSEGPSSPAGFIRVSSAAEGEVAQESDDLQGSLFTHHLLSGMRGSADFDHDGTVTISELYHYGYSRTLRDTHARASAVQHSEMEMALAGRGAFVVTYPRRAAASLTMGPDLAGHVLVIDDAGGRIVAEVHHDAGERTTLAVPPGRYRVQLRGGTEIRSGLVSLAGGERVLRRDELAVQPAMAVLLKGTSFDPHPYVLSLGAAAGTSPIAGFGGAFGASAGVEYRLNESLRANVSLAASYARAEGGVWVQRELELLPALGLDLAILRGESSTFVIGARAGAVAVFQEAEHRQAERLRAAGNARHVERRDHAIGPRFGGVLAFEQHPWSRVGLRLSIEPSVSWIEIDSAKRARVTVLGSMALLVRL